MAYAQTAQPHQGFISRLFSNYAEAKVDQFRGQIYARTVRELENLNDAQLADIGIPRDQIKQRAYQSVYLKNRPSAPVH